MAVQEQKNNIVEYQRQVRYDARLLQQKTDLAGLINTPPSALAPVTYNYLQLPSPPPRLGSLSNGNQCSLFACAVQSRCSTR